MEVVYFHFLTLLFRRLVFQLLDKLVQVENLRAKACLLVLPWPTFADLEALLVVFVTVREEAGVPVGAKRASNVVFIVLLLPLFITLAIGRSPSVAWLAILCKVLLSLARVLLVAIDRRAAVPGLNLIIRSLAVGLVDLIVRGSIRRF